MLNLLPDEKLIAQLFDNQPDSVVWFKPVFGPEDPVELNPIDFEVHYANSAACQILRTTPSTLVGAKLLSTPLIDDDTRQLIFEQSHQAWTTGEPIEFTYHSPGFDRYFNVQRSKVMNGILSITRDRTDTVKAEIEKQQQARLLNSIIESSPYGLSLYEAIRDESGTILDFRLKLCNQKSAEITAFSQEELYRHTMKELMAKRGLTRFFDECVEVVETGKTRHYEVYSPTRKGWTAFSVVKFEDGYLVNYVDVTPTKQQAEEVNAILQASFNGVFSMEAVRDENGALIDFTILHINQAFTRILGLKEEEVVGRRYLSIFPGTRHDGIFDLHCQVLQTGEPVDYEFHYNTDGFDGWYRICITRMGENRLVQTFMDVTGARKDKQALEEGARYLQSIIDSSHTGILVISPVSNSEGELIDFRFETANSTLSALVNQQPQALVGELHGKWFPEYYSNGAFEVYKSVCETGQLIQFEAHFENAVHDRWMDVQARRLGASVLVTYHDITPLKRLQLQLEDTIHDLQRSNERLSEFTHVASHDLKEPLRKVIMYSNLMEEKYGNSVEEGALSFLRRIQQTAYRMQSLINDLLAYAQVSRQPEALQEVDLEALVSDVLADLETAILEKDARISHSPLPRVRGDAMQLRQAFQNLLSNALKFSSGNGQPEVGLEAARISSRELPTDLRPLARSRFYHCISVWDNGIGFSPEAGEKIFQLFQRLHGPAQYEGTGIGLAIVRKVAENHHGFVVAEGRPGEGATFRLYLPEA
jgi:PAS domain S-box-containing protein